MKNKHYVFISSCVIFTSHIAFAQEVETSLVTFKQDKSFKKRAFRLTSWMPNRGVKLLKEEFARKVWEDAQESTCRIPKITDESLRSFDVFQTEHLNIFLFTTWAMTDWVVCRRESNQQEFRASSISGGYTDEDPKKPMGACSSSNENTSVRFRSYQKDGPLLLEVYVGGCRKGESHHEFLFRLDREELEEIPGSRLVMHDYYSLSEVRQGWMWTTERYSRFGKSKWNEDGELTWTRQLQKRSLLFVIYEGWDFKKYGAPTYQLSCRYNAEDWKVVCKEKLIRRARINFENIYDIYLEISMYRKDELDYLKRVNKGLKGTLKQMGYDISAEDLKKLNDHIH